MARELPLDVILEVFEFVHPVRLMQLRAASREWREEAPKQISTLGLIDDLESAYAWRGWCYENRPDGDLADSLWLWRGKFPSVSYAKFGELPNVRRIEVCEVLKFGKKPEDVARLADICAEFPALEELVVTARVPRGRPYRSWPEALTEQCPDFSGAELVMALRGRCPNLHVLSVSFLVPTKDLRRELWPTFVASVLELRHLEVLDARRIFKNAIGVSALIRCVPAFASLRVFVAPHGVSVHTNLVVDVLRGAPLLEQLHVATSGHRRSIQCAKDPLRDGPRALVDAISAHEHLEVLTLLDNSLCESEIDEVLEAAARVHTLTIDLKDCNELGARAVIACMRRGVLRRLVLRPFPLYDGEELVAGARETGVGLFALLEDGEVTHPFAVEACVPEPPSEIRQSPVTWGAVPSFFTRLDDGERVAWGRNDTWVILRSLGKRHHANLSVMAPLPWAEYDVDAAATSVLGEQRAAALGPEFDAGQLTGSSVHT